MRSFQMDEGFSGVVRISNVSDFIAPSQACILPLRKNDPTISESLVSIRGKGSVERADGTSTKVRVSLNDCLACNGCITSAETILIQEQSTPMLLQGLATCSVGVVTVSPQSVCSIAAKRGIEAQKTARLIARHFKRLGVRYVLDSSFGRYLTLALSYDEFVERRHEAPILTSACPGFVCYAEKTHGDLLVPHISRVRSPQAMMGALVKDYLARSISVEPDKIFHATVMPCFDKKLEASRPQFANKCREVDCVLSTVEVDKLLDEAAVDDESEVDVATDVNWLNAFENGIIIGSPGGPSGGYAEYIVRRFISDSKVDRLITQRTQKMKNLEVIEVIDGESVWLKVAKCYGFRNIQNLVQKMKRGKAEYDYVEVMACPAGCANGGGQIRAEKADMRQKLLDSVVEKYEMLLPSIKLEDEIERVKAHWECLNGRFAGLCYT
uniref:Iron hydrogenase large subunit C-terminal domain-containing protein n=2 Tax=Parascaris univalens TaxID=6257 RepID=A0A915B889_PARUN